MHKKSFWILLFLIFSIAFILRFYRLGEIPNGLYQDETAIGYNAYSILQTGRDEYGNFFPLYFKSFGDWKLPVYIYTDVFSVKFFGLSPFSVRLPSALFGFLTVIVLFIFVKRLAKNDNLALFSSFLLAINPWHIHYSRATFETSISLFLLLSGGLLFLISFERRKIGLFFGGTLLFIISLYSYNLTRFLSPLLFLFIILFFKDKLKNIRREEIILTSLISFFLLAPFLLTFFKEEGISSARGTLITSSSQVFAPLLEFKSYIFNSSMLLSKAFFNTFFLLSWQYIQNFLKYLSVDFFFIQGSVHGNHGIGNVGQFYIVELLFIVLGIFYGFIKKIKWTYFLMGWLLLVISIASLTREAPHATRSFFALVPLEIFSSLGIIVILGSFKKIKNFKFAVLVAGVLFALLAYSIIFYLSSYYLRFPIFYAKAWRSEDDALSSLIKKEERKYERVVFDRKAGFVYTSLLFYTKYPPLKFQESVRRLPPDSEGFSEVVSFGKYEFRDIDFGKDLDGKTLIVTDKENLPSGVAPARIFSYPTRPIVISVKENIRFFPITENAYVMVTGK